MQRVELFAIPDLLQRMANARAPARPRTLLQSTPQQAPARPRVSSTESAAEHLMERRKANDGQFYGFSEFVAWYGDKALASWMKADAADDIAADGAWMHDVQAGVPASPAAPVPTSLLSRPPTERPATDLAEPCDCINIGVHYCTGSRRSLL